MAQGFDISVKLDWKGQALLEASERGMEETLDLFGRDVTVGAKARAPVRTGRLRDSIGYRVGAGLVEVGDTIVRNPHTTVVIASGVEKECGYGGFVEEGTVGRAGRPFMRPAFDEASTRIRLYMTAVQRNIQQTEDAKAT